MFLTGYDGHEQLGVMKRTPAGFIVEADAALARLKGQKDSDLNGAFSWRVVAKRNDIEGEAAGAGDDAACARPAGLSRCERARD